MRLLVGSFHNYLLMCLDKHDEADFLKVCVLSAARRQQVRKKFAEYVPKQMTQEELAVQSVSYNSQGAR